MRFLLRWNDKIGVKKNPNLIRMGFLFIRITSSLTSFSIQFCCVIEIEVTDMLLDTSAAADTRSDG